MGNIRYSIVLDWDEAEELFVVNVPASLSAVMERPEKKLLKKQKRP
jgi:hypothetical protein